MPLSSATLPVAVALLIGCASAAVAQQAAPPAAGSSSSTKLPAAPPQATGACSLKQGNGATTCSRDIAELTCKALAADMRATPTWSAGKPCP